MLFDNFHCDDAEGIILAHTLRLSGKTYPKGRVLSVADLCKFKDSGIDRVSGVRLEAGDVDENTAAFELAQTLSGSRLRIGKPVAGRCNLYAASDGLVQIDRQVVDKINQCDSGIVIATLAH